VTGARKDFRVMAGSSALGERLADARDQLRPPEDEARP
jgi:hypothetical protein